MVRNLRDRMLLALRTDQYATLVLTNSFGEAWQTRCIHCRSALYVSKNGEPLSGVTLEHIVPQAWFERPKVIAKLAIDFTQVHDAKNLALACARCNHAKGKHHDCHPNDENARAVVLTLLASRMARYQPPVWQEAIYAVEQHTRQSF